MPFTSLSKPSVGDATRKALIDGVIDNQEYLKGQTDLAVPGIPNGSFEFDTDSDGIPDSWTRTLYTGGTFSHISSDDQQGAYCISMESPGGSGNGGAYVVMEDYFEVSPLRPVVAQWLHKSSVAGIHNKVEVLWFKDDKTASTTTSTTIYDSTSNPTSWTLQSGACAPPSDARWGQIRITGAEDDNTTAGIAYWDGFKLGPRNEVKVTAHTTGATHTLDKGAYLIHVAGCGKGGTPTSNASGGGAEYAEDSFSAVNADFTVGEGLTVVIAGGSGTTLANSGGTIFTANNGGNASSSTGGSAGSGGGASASVPGGAGKSSAASGNDGGFSFLAYGRGANAASSASPAGPGVMIITEYL
tara:strand:- start:1069 stop:2139 length:1071 start_codon:yes stop_codon:yes gene_type:complete